MIDNVIGPLDLGACCACGRSDILVRNIVMLDQRAPVPGTGWGCLLCDLTPDGALSVLCDDCIAQNNQPVFAVFGFLADHRRIPVSDLQGTHQHNAARHTFTLTEDHGSIASDHFSALGWNATTWPHSLN